MTEAPRSTGLLESVRLVVDNATAARVFGEPIAQDGVILLPVAKIGGGGGGGTGPAGEGAQSEGAGGGFGLTARPVGVFVLKDGRVSWRPTVDVNRIVLGGQIVAVTALLVARALIRQRAGGRGIRRAGLAERGARVGRLMSGRLSRLRG